MGGPPSCLSARQETALVAFIDALLPPLSVPSSAEKCGDADQRFWEYRLSADSVFLTTVQEAISQKLSSHDRFMTQSLLTALSTALGTSAIFGVWTVHALAEWPVPERAKLLQRAQYSNFAVRRQAFQGLKRFLCGLAFSYTNDSGKNPFWEAMGYPGSPIQWQVEVVDQQRVQAAMERQLPIIQALEQSQQQLLDDSSNADGDECVLECDAVIVGSGSGGCVAAKVLSAAGYKVIVLEKGRYVAPENIKLSEAAALDQQYEQHGLLQTTSGTIMFLAGAGVGGGTAINWSCCLPLPDYVREEWMSVHGLKDYQSEEYETALHHILDALGVSSKSKCTHNAMNLKLQEGCDALKYDWENTGQNLNDPGDVAAGFIGMGDRYGNKNGGLQTFLFDAVNLGAHIVENCRVDCVLTETTETCRRATGVQCQVGARKLTVKAKKAVILAAGALHTPCLLQKSNFRNMHIGKHLRVHPVTGVYGFFPADIPIDMILGAPMTSVCNEFARGPADDGYGVKIECPCSYPGIMAAANPWTSPKVFRDRMLQYRNCVPLAIIQRDSGDGGSVKVARDGVGLTIEYAVNELDKNSMIKAVQGAAQILVASGSTEVSTGHVRDAGYKRKGKDVDKAPLQEYLDSIKVRGMKDHEMGLFSAHQMGSCRMSTSPLSGVVDPNGETWECDDLFVMDTSIFPTASGSNPMVTVMTIAYMLSTRLCYSLKLRDSLEGEDSPSDVRTGDRAKAVELSRERTAMRSQKDTNLFRLERFSVILPLLIAILIGWMFGRF